jgi:hypothetical protein
MNCKKSFIVVSLFLAVIFALPAAEVTDYLPESCISVLTIANLKGDPGLSWLLDTWIKSPRQSSLREIAKAPGIKDLAVAVFPVKADFPSYILVAMKTVKGGKIDQDKLDKTLSPDKAAVVKTETYKGKTIGYYEGASTEDFSAYCIIDDIVLFGSDSNLVKKALDENPVTKNATYKSVQGNFPKAQDGFLVAENKDGRFAGFLKPLEKKWSLSLLLSVNSLSWIGTSFDIVDSNKASGVIVFQGKPDLKDAKDIKDDAEFIGEAIKRKFAAEKIDYTSSVQVRDKTVTLTIKLEGLEPLWKKLLSDRVFSVISK